jgi:diaminopimelate epimerase
MSGHGNDFIVVDNRVKKFLMDWKEAAVAWCERRKSIGADGLLLIEKSDVADFKLRIINSDGSEAEMCGNGARCAAVFACHEKITGSDMTFETLAGVIEASVYGDRASVKLTDPEDIRNEIYLNIEGEKVPVYFANSGVPHAILFKEDVSGLPADYIRRTGRAVRFHTAFSPEGANVDFVQIAGPDRIIVRTYERGVEAETMACGTGAVASAVISSKFKNIDGSPICVEMPGGTLTVSFKNKCDHFTDAWLEGKVKWVYKGELIK